MSLTFQPSEVHQSSPLKTMLYPPSSKSSPIRGPLCSEDFSSKPSSSSNKSFLISTDSYTILFSSTFIMCNATQCRHLWTVMNFHACNPNKPTQLITAVTTSRHAQIVQLRRSRPYLSASIPTFQSSISRHPPPTRKRSFWTLGFES